jgi:hypothetical protein
MGVGVRVGVGMGVAVGLRVCLRIGVRVCHALPNDGVGTLCFYG